MVVAGSFQGLWLGRAAVLLSVALVIAYAVWILDSGGMGVSQDRHSMRHTASHLSSSPSIRGKSSSPAFSAGLVGDRWTDILFLVFNAASLTTFVVAGCGLRRVTHSPC